MIALLLALALLVGVDHPIFTSAKVDVAGSWTGYQATIQVRPLTYTIWAGGYLSDGTFVQNGLLNNYGEGLYAFAWATHNACCGDEGAVPLTHTRVKPASLTWITFQMVQTKGRWVFRYKDATGWHEQGSWASKATLHSFTVTSEYWAPEARRFETQAVRDVRVRKNGVWTVPTLSYAPSDETCGHEDIISKTKGNLVFKSIETPCTWYKEL